MCFYGLFTLSKKFSRFQVRPSEDPYYEHGMLSIYFPPYDHDRVLKFNPITQKISLIGNSHGNEPWKWVSGVLASDGIIYCVPFNAKHILQIDSRHINEQVIEFVEGICARHECAGGCSS